MKPKPKELTNILVPRGPSNHVNSIPSDHHTDERSYCSLLPVSPA